MHSFPPGTQLTHGLGTAHHHLAHEGQLRRHQPQLFSQEMAVLGHPPAVGRHHHQLLEAQAFEGADHLLLSQGHDRVAVRFLVAGVGERIQGKGIIFRGGHLLFDQATENPHPHTIQQIVHEELLSRQHYGDSVRL